MPTRNRLRDEPLETACHQAGHTLPWRPRCYVSELQRGTFVCVNSSRRGFYLVDLRLSRDKSNWFIDELGLKVNGGWGWRLGSESPARATVSWEEGR